MDVAERMWTQPAVLLATRKAVVTHPVHDPLACQTDPGEPRRYDEIASRAMRLLANASTELAARKARKRTVVDDEEDEGDG